MIELVLTPVVLLQGASPVQDSTERLLRALPSDSMAVVATAGWDEIRRRAAENSWVKFFRDESWNELYQVMEGALREGLQESELDLDPLAILGSIHGPVAGAFARDERGFHATLLLDVGVESAAFEAFFELVWNELEESESHLQRYEGVQVLVMENEAESDEPHLAIFEVDDVFCFVAHADPDGLRERLRAVVDSLQGRDPGRGYNGGVAYLASRRGWNRTPAFRVTLDLARILTVLTEKADERESKLADELGAFDMQWAYANVDLGAGEALEFTAGLHVPRATVLGDFADLFGSLPVDLLTRLPAAASTISLGSYDVWGAWNLLLEVLSNYAPEAFDELQAGLGSLRAAMDLDIEQELLAQLTGRFASFSMPVPPEEVAAQLAVLGVDTVNIVPESSGFLVELDDAYTVEDAAEKLFLISGLGAQIEEIDLENGVCQQLALGPQTPLWAFTEDAFVYGATLTPIQAAVNRAQAVADPAHLKRFRAVVEECGPEVGLLSVSDTRTVVESGLWGLNIFCQLISSGLVPGTAGKLQDIQLPETELAGSYFRGTMVQKVARTRDMLLFDFQAR